MIAANTPPTPKYRYSAGSPFCSVVSGVVVLAETEGEGDWLSVG